MEISDSGMAASSASSLLPVSVWAQYASDVRGTALLTGHFLPEEAPDLVTVALRDFLS